MRTRLINLALTRIRDFQGVSSTSVDGHGNYSLGLEEQLVRGHLLTSLGQRKRRKEGRRHHLMHASSDINVLGTASMQAAFQKKGDGTIVAAKSGHYLCGMSSSSPQGAAQSCRRTVSG